MSIPITFHEMDSHNKDIEKILLAIYFYLFVLLKGFVCVYVCLCEYMHG